MLKSRFGIIILGVLFLATGKDPFSNMMLEHLKLRRIPNIYNAIKAFCDPKGNNFAITRRYQKADQFTIPQILPSEVNSDFSTLLQECSSDDLIHDVVFQVQLPTLSSKSNVDDVEQVQIIIVKSLL